MQCPVMALCWVGMNIVTLLSSTTILDGPSGLRGLSIAGMVFFFFHAYYVDKLGKSQRINRFSKTWFELLITGELTVPRDVIEPEKLKKRAKRELIFKWI